MNNSSGKVQLCKTMSCDGGYFGFPIKIKNETLSHNVVSCTPCLSRIQTHYVSGDRH